jgi:hypothetical protein
LSGTNETNKINSFISTKETELIDYFNKQANATPLQRHMDELKKDGTINNYQQFKALNINSSSDGIYYKVVQTNQEDSIDKLSMFNNYKNIRSTNFSSNLNPNGNRDFNPLAQFGDKYGSLLLATSDVDEDTPDVLHCPLPAK